MSLRAVIEGAGLSLSACAGALGVDAKVFQQWADSQREMPPAYATVLAAVLGIKQDSITSKALSVVRGAARIEPSAIWFKFQGEDFTDADRELILLIRRLGHNANQFEKVSAGQVNRSWNLLFRDVLEKVDFQASPQDQGRSAAREFSALTQLGGGGKGASGYLRGQLRSKGILLIESPISDSQIEGCTFLVGEASEQRPCIFVNTFKTTWFRRNVTIMHELGHAIFDHNSAVEIDVKSKGSDPSYAKNSLEEVRVQAFAKESLLPEKLLVSFFKQTGTSPTKLNVTSLAALVSFSGVEKKTVVEVLRDLEMIDEALAAHYLALEIGVELRTIDDHALTTPEYIKKVGKEASDLWRGKRFTTIAKRKLMLPATYVSAVVKSVRNYGISASRAAELLMIDEDVFCSRFPDALEAME